MDIGVPLPRDWNVAIAIFGCTGNKLVDAVRTVREGSVQHYLRLVLHTCRSLLRYSEP